MPVTSTDRLSARLEFLARLNPAIYDLIHQILDRSAAVEDELNPQPLPPVATGFQMGLAVLETASLAQRLGVSWEPGDELCPPPKKFPPKGWPGPRQEIDDVAGYASGLAAALALTHGQWADLDSADHLNRLADVARGLSIGSEREVASGRD